MSRRPPNPAAERAAQNQQTLKSLVKLESNKVCADCKRNKHPRWASWNLGVFICIRCSGIHRGMGTHISKVKSVDLDSWTDEQLQSVLNWGNARANKYWESKLAAGHAPSEAKIENFIRTKYELKRWVMEGPMPNPASLDVEGDDEIPLSIVKEKQNLDRKESVRRNPSSQSATPRSAVAPPPQMDLIGGDDIPPRASTARPSSTQPPPKSAPAPPKAVNKDSLLGLDFLGEAAAAPPRPASTTGTAGGMGGQSRPDLKQSILSLYASAPRPQQQPQQSGHASTGSFSGFGGMQSPPMQSPTMGHQSKNSTSGFNDAFAGLSFGNSATPKSPQNDAFAGLSSMSSNRSTPQPAASAFSSLSGGGFFDPKPAQPPPQPQPPQPQQKPAMTTSDSFSAFASSTTSPKPVQSSSSGLGDLFDWSSPAPQRAAVAPAPPKPAPAPATDSVFNLSAPQSKPAPSAAPAPSPMASMNAPEFSNSDVWGNAWGNPEPAAPAAPAVSKPSMASSSNNDFGGGWGSSGGSFASQSIVPGASGGFAPTPKVAADEEFGGWTSSTGENTKGNRAAKPSGGFGNDDLFSNVWE
ncbi:Uu.00g126060.m01.CDS01 [Anthostomella pinea]|uniref:Uu.00g126060.m01.CDS01 n=1 Tax=Anthostomella pinea TaxID=933095 RepID=A0AAI8VCL1_9PEZI|nr:Uu.00g126060.m01.CDS01 [Anthostomella pinea]